MGILPAMPLQEVIESCCRGRGLGTWASRPRCRCRKLSNLFVAGETPTSLRGCTSSAQWVVRDVGVSPATTIREAQQRNMPPGIAGETPTSLAFLMVVVGFGCCAGLLELCSVSVSWCGCKGMLINPNRVLRKVREIVFFIRIRQIVSLISLKFSKFACEYAKIVSRTL